MILIVNLLSILGFRWRGWWQYQVMKWMLDNETSIVQGCRQVTGKTWLLTLLATAYIYAGYRVIIGMPTFGQATKILFNNINILCRRLEIILPTGRLVRLQPDNQSYILWNNGGMLIALSAGQLAEKEGFTADLVIVDEGHRLEPEALNVLEPFVSLSMLEGIGRFVIAGVGGPKDSLIEAKKKKDVYKHIKITPERILEEAPKYKPIFDHARKSMTAAGYDQMHNCNVVTSGLRYAFDIIPYDIGIKNTDKTTSDIFGIDVAGHGRDHTVCVHLAKYGNKYVLDDHFDIAEANSVIQARNVHGYINQWMYREDEIAIEKNGPGEMLYDCMTFAEFKLFESMQLIPLSTSLKHFIIRIMKKMMLEGNFAITDDDVREDFEECIATQKPDGTTQWSHSDKLSAAIVAMTTQGQVTSLLPWEAAQNAESWR